jgi:hypothetical protein
MKRDAAKGKVSRVTDTVGRWAFRTAAFYFGFAVLQWMSFRGMWFGATPTILASFFAVMDVLALFMLTLFSLAAVAAQLRPWRFSWHPWAAAFLNAGSIWLAVDVFVWIFAK